MSQKNQKIFKSPVQRAISLPELHHSYTQSKVDYQTELPSLSQVKTQEQQENESFMKQNGLSEAVTPCLNQYNTLYKQASPVSGEDLQTELIVLLKEVRQLQKDTLRQQQQVSVQKTQSPINTQISPACNTNSTYVGKKNQNPQFIPQVQALPMESEINKGTQPNANQGFVDQPVYQTIQSNQAQTSLGTQGIPLPKLEIEAYEGKTYVYDFLQYLLRQKSLLQVTNATQVQQKLILNSKLPSTVSNLSIQQAQDPSLSLQEYIQYIVKFFGPKEEYITQQLMNLKVGRFEQYVVFIQKVQEAAFFANVNDQQQILILNLKLPLHARLGTQNCQSVQQYKQIVQTNTQQGWFYTIDEAYRHTLDRGKGKGKSDEKNLADSKVGAEKIESETNTIQIKTGVTSIQYKDDIYAFANQDTPYNLRNKKRQHIDNQGQVPTENIPQQQVPQQEVPQFTVPPTSTSQQHQNQQTKNENLQKLLDQIRQQQQELKNTQEGQNNQNLNTQNARGRSRQPKLPTIQEQTQQQQNTSQVVNLNKNIILDVQKYIDQQSKQIKISQALQDVCIPLPLAHILQLTGHHIAPTPDQSIPKNVVYSQKLYNNQQSLALQDSYDSSFNNLLCQATSDQEQTNSHQVELYNQDGYQINCETQKQDQKISALVQALENELKLSNNTQYNKVTPLDEFSNIVTERHIRIHVFLNSHQVEGVIDSGAQHSLISLDTVKQCGLEKFVVQQPKDQNVHISGVSGSSRLHGILQRLEVNIQGHFVIWPNVFVSQDPTFHLLIGLDILKLFLFQISINPRQVSFVPTLDDPRIILQLLPEHDQSNQHIRTGYSKIYNSYKANETNYMDIVKYYSEVFNIYPELPIYKTYQLIYCDPPWYYKHPMHGSKPPYELLTLEQLKLLPIQSLADVNGCVLLMWSTGTHIDAAIELMKHWGFRFINVMLVWRKLNLQGEARCGMGYYSRALFEFLLLGTKGKVGQYRRPQNKFTTVSQDLNTSLEVNQKLSKVYSRKPLETYDQITRIFSIESIQSIEIFATERNEKNQSFDLYGNHLIPKFQKQIKYKEIKSSKAIEYNIFCSDFNVNSSILPAQVQPFSQDIINYTKNLNVGLSITEVTRSKLEKLICKYEGVFKFNNNLTCTNLGEIDIILKPNAKPVKMKPYRIVGEAAIFLKNKFQELLKCGLISEGSSEWATAVMCVPKDSISEPFRAVQNFKRVNQQIIKDKYPLRIIDYILLKLRKKKWLCVVDMRGGFNQIRRSARSKHIMAMILPFGQYIPEVMFFGETNAPSVFQRFVDQAIGDLYGKGIECYIDDIVVYGDSEEEVLELLEQLFIRLERTNFKLHPEKCSFFTTQANVLGHKISDQFLYPKDKKLLKLTKIEPPKTKKQLQQYMGSINYYRKFIPNLSLLFKAFQNLLPDQVKYQWNAQAQASFEIIQTFIKNRMQLLLPDLNIPFKVIISIQNFSYSAALTQIDNGGEFVVAFHSQVCSLAQGKMQPYLREVDCLVWALNEWRPYLQHQYFVVQCDYKALKFLFEHKSPNLQILNYQLQLQDLMFQIESTTNTRSRDLLLLTFLQEDSQKLEHVQQQMQYLQNQDQSFTKSKLKSVPSDIKDFITIMQFDGASQTLSFNQKVGAGAFVIFNSFGKILYQESLIFEGSQTNNVAEYQALIAGMKYLIKIKATKGVLIQGDSQLVVRQLNYIYMCNSENLQELCMQSRELIKRFPNCKIEHIDRSYNSLCDNLAKQKLKETICQIQKSPAAYFQITQPIYNFSANLDYELDIITCQICNQEEPEETMILCDHCNLGFHSDCIGLSNVPEMQSWYCDTCHEMIFEQIIMELPVDPTEDWPLLFYLKGEIQINQFPKKTQQRVLARSQVYTLQNDKLYKLSQGLDPREVPSIGEREILVEQIHQLVGHLGMNRTVALIQTTYYWPCMQRQIENTLRRCLLCQAHNPHYLHMPDVFPISKGIVPLRAWYFDCFYLPETTRGYTMAVIAICGTSKWVEGQPMFTNNSIETRDFLWDQIICRYGCPIVICNDRGPEFKGNFKSLLERLNITQHVISPEYPQSNGQVERIHRTIKAGLTKLCNTMPSANYNWDELLQQILFGIRITISRATKYSPYQLLFAQDPVIPGYPGASQEFPMIFQSDQEQEDFLVNKLRFKQSLGPDLQDNLQQMEAEIDQTIRSRETSSQSNLEFGNLVFVKRKDIIFPQTKSKGPYIFLGYNNPDRTTALLVDLKTSKMRTINITKISPIKLY